MTEEADRQVPGSPEEGFAHEVFLKEAHARFDRAAARFAEFRVRCCALAIVGLNFEGRYDSGHGVILQPIEEPPGALELSRTLEQIAFLPSILQYCPRIRHELIVVGPDDDESLGTGDHLMAMIRARTGARFLVPVAASRPWSTIASARRRSVLATPIEDVPSVMESRCNKPVRVEDVAWAVENLDSFRKLFLDQRFKLAVEGFSYRHLHRNTRMSAISIWTSVESLLPIQTETTYRMSLQVATLLAQPGVERVELAQEVRRLYGMRSRLVHGSTAEESEVLQHEDEACQLAGRILCRCIELGYIPTEKAMNHALLSGESLSPAVDRSSD